MKSATSGSGFAYHYLEDRKMLGVSANFPLGNWAIGTELSYRPHDRSPSTQQLVWTLTHELRACLDAATQFRAEWRGDSAPSFPEMLARFEQWSNELTDVVSRMDDASWNRVAQFSYQGRVVSEQPFSCRLGKVTQRSWCQPLEHPHQSAQPKVVLSGQSDIHRRWL